MRFISKNNRVPLVMLTLLVVGYLLFWAYLLREGVIVQQWTYWRLGLLVVVVFLFIISQVSRNETFSIWTILGTIFVSWVAGLLWWAGFLFIMWRVPGQPHLINSIIGKGKEEVTPRTSRGITPVSLVTTFTKP